MIAATYNCGCIVREQYSESDGVAEPPCSPCCFRSPEVNTKATRAAASTESIDELYTAVKGGNKLKKLEVPSEMDEISSDKIVSKIVKKGQPYKEIEAIFNDNRVIVRTHKELVKEEYEPPCECVEQDVIAKESASSLNKCDDGVAFEMADGSLELCSRTPRENASSSTMKIRDRKETTGCRTMTLYPQAEVKSSNDTDPTISRARNKKDEKSGVERPIDLEENPNIFLLRIRKRCYSGDKKHKIDLEFRAPRPWLSRRDDKKKFRSNLPDELKLGRENVN